MKCEPHGFIKLDAKDDAPPSSLLDPRGSNNFKGWK